MASMLILLQSPKMNQDDITREYPWRLKYNRNIIGNMIKLLVMNFFYTFGPPKSDGFNGLFIKNTWELKGNVLDLW